jgi:ABC-type spermidine/putrescine transport system permease subunit II
MIVFISPILKDIPAVVHVSKLPAVSAVLVPVYSVILCVLAGNYLRKATNRVIEGLKLGLLLVVPNVILDVLIYVVLFASYDYFSYLSIWVAYALFLIVPAIAGSRTHAS